MSRADRPAKRPSQRPGPSRKPKKAQAKANSSGHSARERRTRQAVEIGSRGASFVFRHRVGNGVIFLALLVAGAQLFYLQVPRASGLRAEAAGQLKVTDVEKAVRGSIIDRNNNQLAFTIEARALTFQPRRIHKQLCRRQSRRTRKPLIRNSD